MRAQDDPILKAAKTPPGDAMIYEFGARIDKECAAAMSVMKASK